MKPPETASRYESTRHAWEDIWDSASIEVELQAVQYPRSLATIQTYLPYLDKDSLILEAGSGLSAIVITLRTLGYRVLGLDYAENALHASRNYDASLPLLAGDIHQLPCANESIGAYLSFGVLEHFEHGMGPALAEAYRVLRPGGTLILTIPYPNIVQRLITWKRQQQGASHLSNDQFYESTYTRTALTQAVEAAGFTLGHIQPTSHAFTLWGLGGPFRGRGYYETSSLADSLGTLLRWALPWAFNFMTLIIARK